METRHPTRSLCRISETSSPISLRSRIHYLKQYTAIKTTIIAAVWMTKWEIVTRKTRHSSTARNDD